MPPRGGRLAASWSRNALSLRGLSGTRFSGTRAPQAFCCSIQRLREKAGSPAAEPPSGRRSGINERSGASIFMMLQCNAGSRRADEELHRGRNARFVAQDSQVAEAGGGAELGARPAAGELGSLLEGDLAVLRIVEHEERRRHPRRDVDRRDAVEPHLEPLL